MSVESGLNPDFLDLLEAFVAAQVEFIVVGAHALAAHGVVLEQGPRWVGCTDPPPGAEGRSAGADALGAAADRLHVGRGLLRTDGGRPEVGW